MTISTESPLIFEYLILPHGLGGRGGVQRFFLLTQKIPFDEKLVPLDEWGEEKKRMVSSGENPSGTVPVIYAEGTALPQHIATLRYLARVYDVTSGDSYKDYVQDLVADEYQGFRDKWVETAFNGTDEVKASYRKEDLPKQLSKFDALYKQFKTCDTFLSVSASTEQPLWGDAAIFGLLLDHTLTGLLTVDELKAYPRLFALYEAYQNIPAVNAWIASKKET
jgi:glutathione S-transferase